MYRIIVIDIVAIKVYCVVMNRIRMKGMRVEDVRGLMCDAGSDQMRGQQKVVTFDCRITVIRL